MLDDLVNKTEQDSNNLIRTEKFIREHLSVGELNDDCLRIMYNLAYVHFKYLNQNLELNQAKKKISKAAKEDPWGIIMQRVEADREAGRDHLVIKGRFASLLSGSNGFEPI